jgi:NAD(P)H-hydrate epimerase
MQALLTPKDMYDLDAYLIDKIGITEGNLMEGAALSCSNLISEYSKHGSKILIVCGTGNNGGDGLAIAKYLNNNYNVDFIIFGEKSQFNSLSLKNYDIIMVLF